MRYKVHSKPEKGLAALGCRGYVVSRATTPNMPALQQLRDQLHPSLLPLYPELLTPVAPPTRGDIIDVLEQLDAISCATGILNTAQFAMDVISSLVSMIDVGRLQPDDPQPSLLNGGAA